MSHLGDEAVAVVGDRGGAARDRYERGASKPSAEALRRLADALGVSTDYLMQGTAEEAAKARFEDRELLRQFQKVEDLPDDDKHVVKKLLAFLTKKQIQRLAG